jgi:hypothetical protein
VLLSDFSLRNRSASPKLEIEHNGEARLDIIKTRSARLAPLIAWRRKAGASGRRDGLVAHYKRKLEAALGDYETFTAIYNDLRANSAMGKPEMTALAKQMTAPARARKTLR